ncbi:MAG: Gfo/Idh/MocA family oxidoreductase [Armatimonadetes bacterium]|nr:Gfo/Idh/MocA family oxidoreductase [Armatimonadota bacterium]
MLRFGLIGAGNIAGIHAQALQEVEDAVLIAVADPVPALREGFAGKWNVQGFGDYNDMLKLPELDVVCICTPSGLHAPQGIAAAGAGKHVVVEKPIALNPADADALIAACKKNGVALSPVSQRRFERPIARLKAAIDEGRLGRLVLGNAHVKWFRTREYYAGSNWRGTWKMDGGGALMNQSIHAIDLIRWLMGPVDSLYGYTATLAHDIEVEDTATAVLRFASGALGNIEGTTAAWPGLFMRLELHGDKGSAVVQDGDITYFQTEDGGPLDDEDIHIAHISSGAANPMSITSEGHKAQLQDVVAAVREGRPPRMTGEDGRNAVAIICAIYESARTGEAVRFGN